MSGNEDQNKFEESFKKKTTIAMIVVSVVLVVLYALLRSYN